VYPEYPEALAQTHLTLWHQICADGPVVKSKLHGMRLAIMKSAAACRNSRAGCEAAPIYNNQWAAYGCAERLQPDNQAAHGTWCPAQAGRHLQSMQNSAVRHNTMLADGSQCTVFGQSRPYAQPYRTEPQMLQMPNSRPDHANQMAMRLGMPQYQPVQPPLRPSIMDHAAYADSQASSQDSHPALGDVPAGLPALGDVPAGPPALDGAPAGPPPPVLGLVAEFHKKAKAAPAAAPKKVAVKRAKALQVQSHGILFCHTTLNHI